MLVWPMETVVSDQHTMLQLEQLLIRGERSSGKFHKQTKENFISRELIKLFLNIFLNFKPISGQVDRHTGQSRFSLSAQEGPCAWLCCLPRQCTARCLDKALRKRCCNNEKRGDKSHCLKEREQDLFSFDKAHWYAPRVSCSHTICYRSRARILSKTPFYSWCVPPCRRCLDPLSRCNHTLNGSRNFLRDSSFPNREGHPRSREHKGLNPPKNLDWLGRCSPGNRALTKHQVTWPWGSCALARCSPKGRTNNWLSQASGFLRPSTSRFP